MFGSWVSARTGPGARRTAISSSGVSRYGFAEASYDYAASAQYFGLPAFYPQLPDRVDRATLASRDGGSYGAYFADRWKIRRWHDPRMGAALG